MGRRIGLVLAVSALTLLMGCTKLLEREYVTATVHSDIPQAAEESDALRVESYQEMVNALLYLVTERQDGGTLRLYYYDTETATADLTAACLELTEEVPLGAYSVSYLQFDLTTIVSYLEADITITYRRTAQQVDSIQTAVGSSAIRLLLAKGLETFQQEMVLQLDYFDGYEAELEELLQRAYYEVPGSAFGMPQMEMEFYPRTGTQRIVEIQLTYPTITELQPYWRNRLAETATKLVADCWTLTNQTLLMELCNLVMEQGGLQETGSTAYDALLGEGANSEGLALALTLLYQERGVASAVVQGTLEGKPHFWNVILTPWGYRHVDLTTFDVDVWREVEEITEEESPFFSDRIAVESDYSWNRNWVPLCGEQPEEWGEDQLPVF